MLTVLNGCDTIRRVVNGTYRVHRGGYLWIGDYATYESASRALMIANSAGASDWQRGIYDGGVYMTEAEHLEAVTGPLGPENRVTEDDVARTILPGEAMLLVNDWSVKR